MFLSVSLLFFKINIIQSINLHEPKVYEILWNYLYHGRYFDRTPTNCFYFFVTKEEVELYKMGRHLSNFEDYLIDIFILVFFYALGMLCHCVSPPTCIRENSQQQDQNIVHRLVQRSTLKKVLNIRR